LISSPELAKSIPVNFQSKKVVWLYKKLDILAIYPQLIHKLLTILRLDKRGILEYQAISSINIVIKPINFK